MNALSYVASDPNVQIAFLVVIAFIVGAGLLASSRRRHEEFRLRQDRLQHQAQMEVRQFNRELSAVDGKALPAPHPGE